MKLSLNDPKYFKDSISIISELVNEVQFKFDKDGISMLAMDPANVALVNYRLLSSAFTEYDIDKDIILAISLDNLKQIFRRIKPGDIITLSYDEKINKFQIILQGESKRTFSLALLDLEDKEQKIPNLNFPLVINTNSSILDDCMEDMGVVAESVSLIAEPNKFVLKGEGYTNSAFIELNEGEGTDIKIKDNQTVKAKYSLDYLKKITKGVKLSPNVVLRFSNDYPLKIEYNIVDKLSLSIILAPRVSNE